MPRVLILLWIIALPFELPAEESPSMEMLLFLADFVDEQGNWDGPELDNSEPASAVIDGQKEVDDDVSTDN